MGVILAGATRTAVGTMGGMYAEVPAVKLGTVAVQEALKRAGVDPNLVENVIMGIVLQGGLGMNVSRQVALASGIPESSTAMGVNLVCGSALRAVVSAAQEVALGDVKVAVAGGTENMSRSPYVLKKARFGYRMGNAEIADSMIEEALFCSIEQYHMGITAENVASDLGISREDQDLFAVESQKRAAKAMEAGRFRDEIVPVEAPQGKGTVLVDKDEHPRPGTTLERLASLRPAFKKDGTVTAGNASGINDGAAAMVVMTEETAERLNVVPMARVVGYAYAGIAPRIMGLAPVPAIKKVLEKTNLKLGDIELFELNEAFAAQSLGVVRQLGLDTSIVNVNGGAIALGHPVGASGARILVTLLHEMAKRKAKLGLASLCVGGGQSVAVVVENLAR